MNMNNTEARLAEAQRRLDTIQAKRLGVKQRSEALRARLGAGFEAVADGADIPAEQRRELADLIGEEAALAEMEKGASEALSAASAAVMARGIMDNAQLMSGLIREHIRLSYEVDKCVDALALAGDALRANGHQLLDGYRKFRGRNTQLSKGVLALGIREFVSDDQLCFVIGGGLAYRTKWWWHERPMHFLAGALGAIAAMRSEFAELMGLTSVSPAAAAIARADMAAEGVSLQISLDLSGDSEHDIDLSDLSGFEH